MQEQKQFILHFLAKEAECWTKSEQNNLEDFNQCVRQLYAMGTEDMDEAFGIFEENKLEYEDDPTVYLPAYLFKLSRYSHQDFGLLWIAYTSYKNPIGNSNNTDISRGFIISELEGDLKIIGVMSVALRESDLTPVAWKKSVYNPANLNIHDLGKFIAAERYLEPNDDGFSLQDYLAEK